LRLGIRFAAEAKVAPRIRLQLVGEIVHVDGVLVALLAFGEFDEEERAPQRMQHAELAQRAPVARLRGRRTSVPGKLHTTRAATRRRRRGGAARVRAGPCAPPGR